MDTPQITAKARYDAKARYYEARDAVDTARSIWIDNPTEANRNDYEQARAARAVARRAYLRGA